MALDPNIIAIFGPPPKGLDLDSQIVDLYNVIICVVFGIAVAAVGLRFWVRKMKTSKLWHDDWAILGSVVCTCSTIAMTILAGKYGAGEHVWASNVPRFITLLKIVYAEPYVYALAVTSVKISILLLYRRLFPSTAGTTPLYSVLFYMATFATCAYPIILWVTMACACTPVSHYWNQYLGSEGKCIDVKLFFLLLGIVNMLNDIIILVVPVPRILVLQMNSKMKVSIIGIMFLGSFVCVASIVRIYYLYGLFQNVDATWWMGPSFAWSSIEPSIAIISACLPTLAPLFRMGRAKMSSRGTPSGANELSKSGTKHSKGFVLSSNNKAHAQYFHTDDDEVELTCKVAGGDGTTRDELDSKGSSHDDHGITVRTQISVTHYNDSGNEV